MPLLSIQIVQDALVRLKQPTFRHDLRAAVISIISNSKFKGLARVSLFIPRAGFEERPISQELRAARQSVVSL
jgi:hypothetical protein